MKTTHTSRRRFLQQGAIAAAMAAGGPWSPASAAPPRAQRGGGGIPPHLGQSVRGVHVYADRESVFPGQVIRFHVSADTPWRAGVCRLGMVVDDPGGDEVLRDFGVQPSGMQPIHPGSYVHVPRGLTDGLTSLTVEAWLRPWRVDRLMGVVTQEDKESSEGWALGVGRDGYVGCYLGDAVSEDAALVHRSPTGLIQRGR